METYESRVKRAVDAGQVVIYSNVPQYEGNSIVPYAYNLSATCASNCSAGGGPVDVSVSLPNDIYGNYPVGAWYNLGHSVG